MKLTVFCVLLVFSCLVANVEGASWQDQFSNDNLKKAFNTVAKSFHEVGAKVSKALSGDSKKKPFKSVMQSPQNPGNKTTETPNKEESQKESNSSNQPLQNSTSNTTLAPTVAHLWRNSTSSVEILNNTDVSSADVVNEDDLVKNANSLAEIPTDAATSAAETPNKEESEKISNSSNQPLQNSTSNTTLSPTIANLRAYLISLFDIFRNTDVSSVDVVNEEDLVKNSTSLAEIPTDAATSAAEAENLKKTSSSLAEDLNNSTASAAKVLKENSTSLPSAAETFTGDNLNKNSSSLAEILKNEAISGENLDKNGQSLDASIKVSEVVSAQNLQTIINSLAEILQNTSASIGEAISSDKENSKSLGDVLTDAGSNIAGDSNSENLTNPINSLTESLHSSDCIMEIVKTILQFSKKFFVRLQACTNYARIEHIGKASEELIITGKELQSTDGKQCSDRVECVQKFAMGIAKLIKQSSLIRKDVEHLKLDRGLCALDTLASFAESIPVENLREKCSI